MTPRNISRTTFETSINYVGKLENAINAFALKYQVIKDLVEKTIRTLRTR